MDERDHGKAFDALPDRLRDAPDGFEWGFSGSGPGDLSLNILNMFVPPDTDGKQPVPYYEREASRTAWGLHQDFKGAVITRVPWEAATLPGKGIHRWIDERTRETEEGN